MYNFFVFFVLHRIGFLEYFYPKLGQDFNSSVVPLNQNMDQVPPPGEEFIDILSWILMCSAGSAGLGVTLALNIF